MIFKVRAVPRFTGKTRITGKTTEIPERPKNDREILICPWPMLRQLRRLLLNIVNI